MQSDTTGLITPRRKRGCRKILRKPYYTEDRDTFAIIQNKLISDIKIDPIIDVNNLQANDFSISGRDKDGNLMSSTVMEISEPKLVKKFDYYFNRQITPKSIWIKAPFAFGGCPPNYEICAVAFKTPRIWFDDKPICQKNPRKILPLKSPHWGDDE